MKPNHLILSFDPPYAVVHPAKHILRTGVALRCSEPKPPPHRLASAKRYRPIFAVAVHAAELILRISVALC